MGEVRGEGSAVERGFLLLLRTEKWSPARLCVLTVLVLPLACPLVPLKQETNSPEGGEKN